MERAGADTITFTVPGTITLTSGVLSITDGVTITGNAAGTTIVQNTANARVFSIATNINVSLTGLGIQGGNFTGNGGGIYNNGACYLINSTVSGNTASVNGGGIYNDINGYLSIDRSTISGNTATAGDGGAIYNTATGVIDIYNSTISGNTAGNNGGGDRQRQRRTPPWG